MKTKYPGRSEAAKTKSRRKGKFIKTSDVSDDFSYVMGAVAALIRVDEEQNYNKIVDELS